MYFPIDVQPDAKQKRFESIFNALKANRFWISSDVPKAQVDFITHELTRFKYGTARQRDDVSDSLANLIAKLQVPIAVKPKEAPASQSQIILAEKQLRDFVYGSTKDLSTPEPAWGYRVEELKPETPLTEFEGQPVLLSAEHYLYQTST